jgi:hypothetical protein
VTSSSPIPPKAAKARQVAQLVLALIAAIAIAALAEGWPDSDADCQAAWSCSARGSVDGDGA